MAGRSCNKMVLPSPPVASQPRKLLPTNKKPERLRRGEGRRDVRSASGLTKTPPDELLAKEEHFKLLNAELDAKTADLVKQTEQIMRDQIEVLSKPFSALVLTDIEDDEDSWMMDSHQDHSVKASTKKRIASQNMVPRKQAKEHQAPEFPHAEADLSAVEYAAESFLANAIRNMEEKMSGVATDEENDADDLFNVGGNVVSDAQIRVLKAKLRIMQEELDQLSSEYYKKDDENVKLSAKIKELEEDRVRLQKTVTLQQTQIEKQRVFAEESGKRCDDLQLQVSASHKEIQNLTRSTKQAAGVHSSTEVRLNRALEEVEKLKSQLSKMKQTNKDKISEEHQSKEGLLAENKMLKKQKSELVVGFKKQLKLIDILKRQKMHFEAAKLLSFSEEEFMKALDWGKS